MLPRSHRLRHTKEIQYVLRHGQCLTTPYLRMYRYPSPTPFTRVACVVGTSVHRSAVRRHRYQRWLRELSRNLLRERPLPVPYDMVWVAQPSIIQADSLAKLYQDVAPRWEKLRAALV